MVNQNLPKKWQKPILRTAWRYVYRDKGNFVLGITGMPNTGKSWTGNKVCLAFSHNKSINDWLCYSVEQVIDKTFKYVNFKGRPMSLEMINKIPDIDKWIEENIGYISFKPGRCIMLDEAGVAAYVREFFSKDNKNLVKLIQIWRFLRMIIVIVVPGDMGQADSSIFRFLNVELQMMRIDHAQGFARCIGYELIGWKKKGQKKEPVRRRLTGCRHGGYIKINRMSNEDAEQYEKAMVASKIGNMMKLAKQYKQDKALEIGNTRNIWDDVEHVLKNPDEFLNRAKQGGRFSSNLIEIHLGISKRKSVQVKALADQKYIKTTDN